MQSLHNTPAYFPCILVFLSKRKARPAMLSLDALIDRTIRSTPTKPLRIPVPPDLNEPQALVLILTITTCENCGHQTHAHNSHMMVRYGSRTDHAQSIKHTRADCERFAHLPRETRTFANTSPYCPECF